MKRKLVGPLATLAVVTSLLWVASATAGSNRNFSVHLSGDEEVPPRATQAQGQALFQVSKDGSSIRYKLIVANIENVVAAHVHLAPPGANGPVVAPLYLDGVAGSGRTQGVLAEGTIDAEGLAGPLAGGEIDDLVEAMNDGATYVNVHTNDGVAPSNSGPGDFQSGEIRGQIE
jgi:hypothetical protein